jgi:hypothetical protein
MKKPNQWPLSPLSPAAMFTSDGSNPYGSIAEQLRRSEKRRAAWRAEDQGRAAEFEHIKGVIERAIMPDAEKIAQQIIRAGMKRRAELKEPARFTDDASGRLAEAICRAAAKRDGRDF